MSISRARLTNKERIRDFVPHTWLAKTSEKLYFTRASRDLHKIDVCVANTETGEVKVLVKEQLNTYVEIHDPVLVNNDEEFIHWSERDGWAHFYLYDGEGNLKNQITSGPWHSNRVVKVDERNRVMYFTANAREKGENPYYEHLYRVNLDGSGLTLINAGNFMHQSVMSDSYKFFVDNFSRVNTTPKSEIRDNSGRVVMKLETADLSNLFAAGYKFPEVFKTKAADGITDIFGVMYKPFDFDSTKKYPVIEYVYPGQRHGYGDLTEYFFWLKGDYFCKHLIGDASISTDIFEMRREHKMTPSKKRVQ
ncbi:MAG: DPP IV N-terminal domain-containing protein [Prolixibacteraceae bacterium]|nr:DPP IV N-terminal domain-containing protein [Prolixibacteraceae bacterium]